MTPEVCSEPECRVCRKCASERQRNYYARKKEQDNAF